MLIDTIDHLTIFVETIKNGIALILIPKLKNAECRLTLLATFGDCTISWSGDIGEASANLTCGEVKRANNELAPLLLNTGLPLVWPEIHK